LRQLRRQRCIYGRSRRADMLERCSRGQARCMLQLPYELERIERIQQVNEARVAVHDADRQWLAVVRQLRLPLMRVHSVTQMDLVSLAHDYSIPSCVPCLS